MRRLLTLIAVLMTLLTGSLSTISAQERATPAPTDASGAVTIYGPDGNPVGNVVVDALVDPFQDYESGGAPQRGFHFVMASLTVTATEGTFDAYPYGLSLVDAEGFVYSSTYVYRSSAATEALPDFEGGTIEAGQSVSGAVFFEVLNGTEPALLVYQPTYETLVTVADLRDEPVAEGDAVEFLDSDGQPTATITVEGVIAPLKDYDPSYAPRRGFEYVAAHVTIENTGTKPLEVDPYDFVLVDAEGFLYNSYGAYRTPEAEAETPSLQYDGELGAGESVSGLVIYQTLAGTEPSLVYYAPSSDRHVRLAEYGESQAPKPSGTPAATIPDIGAEKTPVTASSAECQDVLTWAQASIENINTWTDSFETVSGAFSGEDIDPDAVRDAADAIDEAADNQEEIDTPELAQDANDALVSTLRQSADILRDIADAAEAGDDAAVQAAVQELILLITDEGSEINTTFTALSEACPELDDIDVE